MVDYIGACPICHGNRAAYPQAPSGQQAEPTVPWRCFHCDATFTDSAEAQDHFGRSEYSQPACQIDAKEYRAMEERMRRYNDEDSDLHRTMYGMQADHSQALMREEEKGYARGLKDGQAIAGQQSERPAPAGQAVGEREAFVKWLSTTYPRTYDEKEAERLWHFEHVSALAWKERAALAASQAERPAVKEDKWQPKPGDPEFCA
jgi:hypothetical protein